MKDNKSIAIKFGLGIGVLYAILLFIRWSNASKPFIIGPIAMGTFALIAGILFFESYFIKKQNGGFITMQELFKTLFVSVLIFELFYTTYNYIHFTFIDPHIIAKMKAGATAVFKNMTAISEKDKQAAINNYGTLIQYTQPLKMLQSYITSIAVSGSIAALVAFIMKKNPIVAK